MKQTIYKVQSDNYDGAYMTAEAYKALTLQMSSGDYGAHSKQRVSKLPKGAKLLTLKDIDAAACVAKVLKTYPDDLRKFAIENSFHARNSRGGLDSYANYSGPDFDYWVCSVGQGRDSDLVSRSNFSVALDMFGGESETVEVRRFGHWCCGWIEGIMIDPTDRKALETAYSIHKALQYYPVLDDSAYSELELESADEDFDNYQSDFERNILTALGLKRDELERDMTKAERKQFAQDLEQLARLAHESCVSWSGAEDAYVSEDNALERIADFERSNGMISDLGELGELALAACGLELNPNYQPRTDYKAKYIPAIHARVIAIGEVQCE